MSKFIWIFTIVLYFQLTHSYILLTANLEDVHEIAKQIAASPVAGTLNNILRRATNLFNQQVGRYTQRKRADENFNEINDQYKSKVSDVSSEDSGGLASDNNMNRRVNGDEGLLALGKNASQYLQSMKQIFEEAKSVSK